MSTYDYNSGYGYKSSSAYDFELFMPKEKERPAPKRNNIVRMPKKEQPKAKSWPLRGKGGALCMSALVIFLLCYMIFTRVEISEAQDQVKTRQAELEQMKSEHTRLSMQIESQISFKSVEEAAKEMGMVKKDKNSVKYVTVANEDKVEIGQTEPK